VPIHYAMNFCNNTISSSFSGEQNKT